MSYFDKVTTTANDKAFVFHDGASASGNGNRLTIRGEYELRVGIKQNSTNSVIECHGIDSVGNDEIIKGYDRNCDEVDNVTAVSISVAYPVGGYEEVYFKTVAANIMIKGKLVG